MFFNFELLFDKAIREKNYAFISNILNKRGYNVIVRSSNSADDDLCLMVKAKYFIPGGICNKIKKGGGGYCGLVRFLRSGYNIITIYSIVQLR